MSLSRDIADMVRKHGQMTGAQLREAFKGEDEQRLKYAVSNAAYNNWVIGPKSRALLDHVVYRASDQTAFRGPACAEEVAISWATMDERWRSQAGEIEYEDHPRSVAAPRILWRGSPPPARSACGSSAAMMVAHSPGIYSATPTRFVREVDDAEVKRRTLRGESQHRIAAALGVSRAQVCSARRRIKQAHGTSFSVHTGSKTSKYE
jgi:hypothetical protein